MHASRKTDVLCLLAAALLGCRTREEAFLTARVPVAHLDSILTAADSVRLPLADARALLEVVAESGFAAKAPRDTMTGAEILAWARAERTRKAQVNEAARAAELARQDSVKRELEPLLAVTVV